MRSKSFLPSVYASNVRDIGGQGMDLFMVIGKPVKKISLSGKRIERVHFQKPEQLLKEYIRLT